MKKHGTKFKMVFPLITIAFAGFFIAFSNFYEESWGFDWQNTRKEIIDSVQVAEKNYHQFGYGESGYSLGSKRLRWISRNASISELTRMLEYPNGSIKLSAYLGLLNNTDYTNKKEILIQALKDTTPTPIIYGCIIKRKRIKDHFAVHTIRLDTTLPPTPPLPDGRKYKEYLLQKYQLSLKDEVDLRSAYYNVLK